MNKIEINNFKLNYDGAFFKLTSTNIKDYVYIKPSQIIKMAEIEGISIEDIEDKMFNFKTIKFEKVTLIPSQETKNNKQKLDYPLMWEHPTDICKPFEMLTVEIKKSLLFLGWYG